MERPEHPKREIKQPETSVQPGLYIGVKKERKKGTAAGTRPAKPKQSAATRVERGVGGTRVEAPAW